MSIIVLTPKPPQAKAAGTNTVAQTEGSLAARVGEDFLHLLGHEGYRFDSFEQLRDFAQAQIDATALANKIEDAAPVVAELAAAVVVEPAAPVPAPAAEGSHDAAAAVAGSAEATPDSIIVLTPPPPQ